YLFVLSSLFPYTGPDPSIIYTLSLHDALPIYTQRKICIEPESERSISKKLFKKSSIILPNIGNIIVIIKAIIIPVANKRAIKRRSEEHTSELQSRFDLVCRLLLEKKNITQYTK